MPRKPQSNETGSRQTLLNTGIYILVAARWPPAALWACR